MEIDPDALAQGDPVAWAGLVAAHRRRMANEAVEILRSWHDAQDVVQAVLVRVWIARRRVGHVRSIEGYLVTAVRNEARTLLRHRRRKEQPLEREEETRVPLEDPSDARLKREEQALLLDQLERALRPSQRAVFRVLRRDPELSSREVGRVLGCSHKNVLATIVRIRRSIEREFTELQ